MFACLKADGKKMIRIYIPTRVYLICFMPKLDKLQTLPPFLDCSLDASSNNIRTPGQTVFLRAFNGPLARVSGLIQLVNFLC